MSEEEKGSAKIEITIKFPDSEELKIKCKYTTPFSKLYDAVAKNRGCARNSFRLQWDDTRLGADETPKIHEFSEAEQIDFMQEQIGGSSSSLR